MKKLATKKDLIIIAVILFLGIGLLLISKMSPEGSVAVIKQDGKVVCEISLKGDYLEKTVNGVTFCRENGTVYVKDSTCKDKICVRTGKLSNKGESAVCAPNKVSVEIKGKGKKSPDAITG